jgi:glyoxylase-like metal-dependent hydrolase (beta-lactamase superfamily II)
MQIGTAISEEISKNLTLDSIAPDLFNVTHSFPWPSNSLVVVMKNNDILLLDVPYTPEATDSLLNWIYRKYGRRNIVAVNTHFHVDRLGGNASLVKHNIPIYSSELTVDAIKNRSEQSLKLLLSWISDESVKNYYKNFKYVGPTRIFDSKKGLTLNFGKELVYVKFLGVGHSFDNLIVYLPDKKAIFGGCMVLSMEANKPGNVSDGNKEEWLKTIQSVDTNGYNLIIPGHGKYGGTDLIKHTASILSK